MPNVWDLDCLIIVSAETGGNKVERKYQITKIPWYFASVKPSVAMAYLMPESQVAKRIKADMEGSD